MAFSQAHSATILTFPRRAEADVRLRVRTAQAAPASSDNPKIVWGSDWYHEAAVEEDREAREASRRHDA